MRPRAIGHLVTTTVEAGFFEFHARAALARGVRPVLLTLRPAPPPTWLPRVPGASYQSLGAGSRKAYPLAIARLAALLRREQVDVLHTHLFDAMAVGVIAGRLARVPLIAVTRHHLDDAILAGARNQDRIERALSSLAHCIVAPSAAVRRHLIEYERHPPERIEHIYHGWDFSRLDSPPEEGRRVRRELGIAEGEFLLGTVGRFSRNKGHEYLLEALARLVRTIPAVRLLLLGEGDQTNTRATIARLGLGGRVLLAGWRPDVAACLRAMDVLVHPSLSEAFCQVIIEGMAVGLPVVSTSVGGAPETITHDQDGLLVPARDATAIAEAIEALYRDPERRQRLAAEAHQSVRRRFTADKMIDAYYALYDRRLPQERPIVSPHPTQPVKTLYISYFGAQKHLSHSQILPYLRQLAAAGVQVSLLSFEEGGVDPAEEARAVAALRADLQAAGIDWHWLRYHKRPSVPATAFDVAVGTVFAGWLVWRKGIDVVHARGHVPGLMGLALERLLGVKLLFDLRGLMGEEYVEAGRWPAGGAAFRAVKWVEGQLFERAEAVVMLTRAAVRTLRERSPQLQRSRAHVEVIPCCVDLQKFRPVSRQDSYRQRLGLEGKQVMVYVGSTGGWYMSEELARLFAAGRAQQPNLHFLVLTQSPHEEMRGLLEREGLPPDSFTIATARSAEMPAYLASADFGVHFIRPGTAMIANSPTKFAEYLASGLPILTNTGIGDSDEILREEGVGVILPEFGRQAYEQGLADIRRLLADPDLPRRCREAAVRRFDLGTVGLQGYTRVYQALGWAEAPAEAPG